MEIENLYLPFIKNKDREFFYSKGYSDWTIELFGLCKTNDFLNDELFKNYFKGESETFLNSYCYLIPGYDEYHNFDYLMIRRRDDFVKSENPYMHKTLFLGDNFDRGIGKIYSSHHLVDESSIVFIVETWTDALSLEEIGLPAIGMNRVINCDTVLKNLLIKHIDSCKNKFFVVMCDSDEIGQQADENIYSMIKELKLQTMIYRNYPEGIKDANEWLLSDKTDFKDKMHSLLEEIKNG